MSDTHNAKWGTHGEGSLPALLLDILETNRGRWYTSHQLVWAVQELRPAITTRTIQRAVVRLRQREEVSTRLMPSDNGTTINYFSHLIRAEESA